jgi:L-2-hydroxyglutarate oxidase
MSKKVYDFAILGGGIYGMNIARELLKKFKGMSILLLDKEKDISNENPLLILNNTEYLSDTKLNKYNYIKEGHIKLKDFCINNIITYLEKDNIVLAKSKKEIEIMNKKTNELEDTDINFEKVKAMESLIYETAKNRDFYCMGVKGLVDYNMFKRCLYDSIEKEVEFKKVYVDQLVSQDGEYKIMTKRFKAGGKERLDEYNAKYVINTMSNDTLRVAQQVSSELQCYNQYNFSHSYYKLPNKRDIRTIISSPQSDIYPGLMLYQDLDGYCIIGPVIKLTHETKGIINKLLGFKAYLSYLSALVQTTNNYEYEIYYNHIYKAKSFYSTFLELYYVIGTEKLHSIYTHSILVHKKRVLNDIIILKENNSIHLLNNNIDNNGLTMLFPITETILNTIK